MLERRQILGRAAAAAAAAAAVATVVETQTAAAAERRPEGGSGLQKIPVFNRDKAGGPHALRLRNVSEWMVFAGHASLGKNNEILFPGDALGQLRWIWGSLTRLLQQEGFSLADVVQLKMTCTVDVPLPDRVKFLDIAHEVFADVAVRPTGATMSVVDCLAYPGMLVEVDITAAR